MTTQTLELRIRDKIRKSRRMVFLRDDFAALGGYDQVGRVLRQLEAQGRLVRIGKGLYAKARPNRITGKPMIAAPGGFDQAAKEALNRLGVQWEPARKGLSGGPHTNSGASDGQSQRPVSSSDCLRQISLGY